MNSSSLIPAASYVRNSTDHQKYSLENQQQTIETYAASNGFSVIRTYSDSARSGVLFRNRKALQQLISDVIQKTTPYKAILVYDVSRWGRFQDTDESAYYEFLCKSAGIPVHYCAETFVNDGGLPSLIMKAVKRAMAGEYSRELGVKVYAAQKRMVRLGFRQGAAPGYGLRRLLVTGDGCPKQTLNSGERKSLASDRVILIPGPKEEVDCVRDIYKMFLAEKMTFHAIARELNRQKIPHVGGTQWDHRRIHAVLTKPKYAGFNVYGRSTQRLYTPQRPTPESEWTIAPGAFDAIVEPQTFAEAQRRLRGFTWNKSDGEFLEALRAVLAENGRLTLQIIKNAPGVPSPGTYGARFGSLSRAYELIGYSGFWSGDGWLEKLRNIRALRANLMREIVSCSSGSVSIEDRGLKHRTRLRLRLGRRVAVIASRSFRGYKGAVRWIIKWVPDECRLITLVARLDKENHHFQDMFLIPGPGSPKGITVKDDYPLMRKAILMRDPSGFDAAIRAAVLHRGRKQ
jgi:DNA invertase Pin-like site-specific DNA recombinase